MKKGKIIGIIILLIVVYIGFTIYQGYSLAKVIQEESKGIQEDLESINEGDCSRVLIMGVKIEKIKNKLESSCTNPLLKIILEKLAKSKLEGTEINFSCNDVEDIYQKFQNQFNQIKMNCNL